ncbi:MAG TPA: RNA polymerase sigma factor [Lachnospiraceae bacterium]|nr:RNA polymerase sigma factor [Lachnospiraceae bacterium]
MSVDFEKLYNTYYMEVYSYVMTILKNQHSAEDVTQEVFLKAMKSENSFQGKASVNTWLCAIAKNACLDILRKQNRFTELDEEEIPSEQNMEQLLEDKRTSFQIHQLLHDMEEPYKEVFQLKVFGELNFQAISKIFGKTESWGRVTYHRARLKLMERMKING